MNPFSISDVYLDKNGRRTLDINPLSENYCSFDCVFCPLGRTKVKTDKTFSFNETESFIKRLEAILKTEKIDIVFINPDGESLANNRILDVINLIKKYKANVKLLSNGYIFNIEEFKHILNQCDEIIGELAVTNEKDFQKLQRPINGYTLENYISNMEEFNNQYNGKFILDITILKNYSDDYDSIQKFKNAINMIKPDEIYVETPSKGKLGKAFGVSEEKLKEISSHLKH
ncbi:Fe-S oxidoreductase [Gottschalkia purinilytica]|uniref:Fe-S oxidoreductase n=1 Tax=Gottschalkia purinilytica TaxID=1503 RepID=A0A0L0WBA1_GOTPU|nr:radical SAM protein [Gottschalkia purinilytica]KNF08615.1 Fe-S oxidoreductase [Gottschalkia purinilytica]